MNPHSGTIRKAILGLLTIYAFLYEFYWLIIYAPKQNFGTEQLPIFTVRLLLFIALLMTLLGRLFERHTDLIAHDLFFHAPRKALVFIVSLVLIIQILIKIF